MENNSINELVNAVTDRVTKTLGEELSAFLSQFANYKNKTDTTQDTDTKADGQGEETNSIDTVKEFNEWVEDRRQRMEKEQRDLDELKKMML